MPKGVVCGGEVDGSNHDGAMVTCQAITTSPGAGWAAAPWAVARSSAAASMSPRREAHGRRRAAQGALTGGATGLGAGPDEARVVTVAAGVVPDEPMIAVGPALRPRRGEARGD